MRHRIALLIACVATAAYANFREFLQLPADPALDSALRHTADAALKAYPKLTADNLAISIIDVTKPDVMSRADYHGDTSLYPASVVKLFFMVETFHQGKQNDPDVPRALHEMIGVSDNDATAYIVDTISDTCSGPELEGRALAKFIDKRRVANRYFNTLGYDISAMSKPWSFGPYGRDMQVLGGTGLQNRNRATANAFASLLLWIVRRRAVSPQASDAMMALLARPLDSPPTDPGQVTGFIGEALPAGSKLWSKAGWTNDVRHDAAYFELPNGRKFIVVILTRGPSPWFEERTVLPFIARSLLSELSPITPP